MANAANAADVWGSGAGAEFDVGTRAGAHAGAGVRAVVGHTTYPHAPASCLTHRHGVPHANAQLGCCKLSKGKVWTMPLSPSSLEEDCALLPSLSYKASTSPSSPKPSTSLAKQADELVRSVTAAIWTAASRLGTTEIGETEGGMLHEKLLETTRAHLVKSHPQLITLHEVVTRKRSFSSDSAILKRKRVALKPWTPTRPDLAILVARALESNECVTTVPEDKRSESRLPFKAFSKQIAVSIERVTEAPKLSHACILRSVTETVARVFALAQSASDTEECAFGIELHGSTDAAWKGTAARGSGIAMDEEGRHLVAKAAAQLAHKLELYCSTRL